MLDYLCAKAADYAVILTWADQQVQYLCSKCSEHQPLLNRLRDSIDEAQFLLGQLQIITHVGHHRLISKAFRTVHQIEYWIIIITSYYIPALQRENKDDLALRALLIPTAIRCGLSWIEDIAVRLDGQHATVAVLTETPVIFAPPQHSASLLDMAGLYHEFGHNAFRRFPTIADDLSASVLDYYFGFSQQAGPMSPNKKAERDRAIDEAITYWDEKRLEEIFCDIYATIVVGPVHYFSCTDMALRSAVNPFFVDVQDVHPPLAARVYVCDTALSSAHQNNLVVLTTRSTWRAYIGTLGRNAGFQLICAPELLDRLTEAAIRSIETFLPDVQRYDRTSTVSVGTDLASQDNSLEDILNAATRVLLASPNQYAAWEEKVLKALLT